MLNPVSILRAVGHNARQAKTGICKSVSVITVGIAIASLSACASHKELKSPCFNGEGTHSSLFEALSYASVAFAGDDGCGPMVRQSDIVSGIGF